MFLGVKVAVIAFHRGLPLMKRCPTLLNLANGIRNWGYVYPVTDGMVLVIRVLGNLIQS